MLYNSAHSVEPNTTTKYHHADIICYKLKVYSNLRRSHKCTTVTSSWGSVMWLHGGHNTVPLQFRPIIHKQNEISTKQLMMLNENQRTADYLKKKPLKTQ